MLFIDDFDMELLINGQVIDKMLSFRSFSSRIKPIDKIEFVLSNVDSSLYNSIEKDFPVVLNAGYSRFGMWTIFDGFVSKIRGRKDLTITAKDRLWQIDNDTSKRFHTSFNDIRADRIINCLLALAGIEIQKSRVSTDLKVKKSFFWLKNDTFTNSLQKVSNSWRTESDFFFRDGIFYWRSEPDDKNSVSEETRTFEQNDNLINVDYEDGKGRAIVKPPAVYLKHSDDVRIRSNDVPDDLFRVDSVIHVFPGKTKARKRSDETPHSIIEFSEKTENLSIRDRLASQKKELDGFGKIVDNIVSDRFSKQLIKEDIIEARVILSKGNGPFFVNVLPLATDDEGKRFPVIRNIKIDNQKIPRSPKIGDIVRIAFIEGDSSQPFVLDYLTSIYDTSNDFYYDNSNQPHFVSNGDDILLKKQANITAPSGGSTVDSEARTAIDEIRTLLSELNLH